MTALMLMGKITAADKALRLAKGKMERRKDAIYYIGALSGSFSGSKTHDVSGHENRMIRYMEAVDDVAMCLDRKNEVIDQVEEWLEKLQTPFGAEVIRARYIQYKKMDRIAGELNYSKAGIYKLLDHAMKELDQVLKSGDERITQ